MPQVVITSSATETKKFAQSFAKKIIKAPRQQGAFAIGLCGELGSGKTCFAQGFVREFGIRERITSPTYVLMKRYPIAKKLNLFFADIYHFDCYRLEKAKDILDLGFEDIVRNPKNIILIEWPEKIKSVLPKNKIFLKFLFIDNGKREIAF